MLKVKSNATLFLDWYAPQKKERPPFGSLSFFYLNGPKSYFTTLIVLTCCPSEIFTV